VNWSLISQSCFSITKCKQNYTENSNGELELLKQTINKNFWKKLWRLQSLKFFSSYGENSNNYKYIIIRFNCPSVHHFYCTGSVYARFPRNRQEFRTFATFVIVNIYQNGSYRIYVVFMTYFYKKNLRKCISAAIVSLSRLTDWMTSWSRGPLEKLIVTQLVKKFPAFYGTRRFITVFTRAHHWSEPDEPNLRLSTLLP
jgi:hypothetical protein